MVIAQAVSMLKPPSEAVVLLAHYLKRDKSYVLANRNAVLSREIEAKYLKAVERRKLGMPIAYITGRREFYSMEFDVSPDCLIPRPETEILVERALDFIEWKERHGTSCLRVLDLCTGSGCIAIAIAANGKGVQVQGWDISEGALAIARTNAKKHGVNVTFKQVDIMKEQSLDVDLIVSNPPYIATGDIEFLMKDVSHFEPRIALDGGEDGLEFYRAIIKLAGETPIFFEVGDQMSEHVAALLRQGHTGDVETFYDYSGIARVVCRKEGVDFFG